MTIAEALAQAWQHQQGGNLEKAEAFCRQALAVEPQNAGVQARLHELAVTHYKRGLAGSVEGRQAEAIVAYREALRIDPDFAEAHNALGITHALRGEWDEALEAQQKALGLKPNYVNAWINLGWTHWQRGDVDEAVRCYRRAIALGPDNVMGLNNLGQALLFQQDAAEAGECFRRALRLRPDSAATTRGLAEALGRLQRWEEAITVLQDSLARNSADAETHAALGGVFHGLGRYGEALDCFRQVLALCPNDAKARLLVQTLTSGMPLTRVPVDYLAAHYDSAAQDFNQRGRWRTDRSPALLQAALAPAANLDILDLGCGTGLCGAVFRSWARTLAGVDVSANMLAQARARRTYDELIQSDLLDAVTANEARFDLILAADVICYFGDLTVVFAAVGRALRPYGRFAFTFELHDGSEDYCLIPLVHFAHSRNYLHKLATHNNMREMVIRQVYRPRESGYYGRGYVAVFGSAPV